MDAAREFYTNKNILAPMVRVCTMPTRLQAAEYGADIVYSEEILDYSLMRSKRVENHAFGTVEFVNTKENSSGFRDVIFQTIPEERGRLVLQLGTGDATRALKCALLAAKDISAVDINMGCPLKFSTSSGAGSALLKKPEQVRDIMTTLRRNLPSEVHVTCKIRLLETTEKTIELARVIEACGVSAFGVHARYVSQRPRQPAHWDLMKHVVESVSCPVIANGDVFKHEDFERIKSETGAASAMCGRAALWNLSVFREEGLLPARENLNNILKKCLEWNHTVKNTKYLLRELLIKSTGLENEEGNALNKSKTLEEIARTFEVPETLIGSKRREHLKRPCEEDALSLDS